MPRQLSQVVLQTPKQVIHLSSWCFLVWWVLILAVHVVTCVFNGFYAYGYWNLHGTYLNVCLEFYHIGMPAQSHAAIAAVHGLVSAVHGLCILLMLGGSLRQQALAFTPWTTSTVGRDVKTHRSSSPTLLRSAARAYGKLSYLCGLCGVNGEYFDAGLVCREVVETALQTVQAYRMSVLLPRTLLNRSYVVLLAANCWSSVAADSVFFGRDEARRRFACIVLDCVLDLMACTGVQLLVMANYVRDYNPSIQGFDEAIWYDDEWVARALNEFRMVVVVSWSDLASRAIFSLGLAITTTSMKRLLWRLPRTGNRVAQSTPSFAVSGSKTLLRVNEAKTQKPTPVEELRQESAPIANSTKWFRTHRERTVLRSVHLLFVVWGVVVLGLHIHTSVQPTLPQCFMQVRPWAVSRPSCYLVDLDCHALGISGGKGEVEGKWSEFDASTVVQLLIRHCPGLEVPEVFTEFSGLHGMKVYNSTIVQWGEPAAITNAKHPTMAALYLVRVNMTDGVLPMGLRSLDFPKNLIDVEFCVTNLQTLPDDLATKWPSGGIVYVEYSQLATVPRVLAQIQPSYLSVAGNPITELPPELFEVENMFYLFIGETNVSELPRNVTRLSTTLSRIYIIGTNISFFWSWMDAFVERTEGQRSPLRAVGSTYCTDVEKLHTGATTAFRVPFSPAYSTRLMNPAAENRQTILNTVDCNVFSESSFYPLTFDDSINAISAPPALHVARDSRQLF
ncbi:Centrosomal protein of 41 kDa [Phytophthora pseudosyringae]|uniref:Centrosomal protein of 41 kDa n=1 Tax=Phytophthora pseudosyringae TaxID=221518 RepID=A0A8T1VP27_9STRA|nr:Centrosomal protein of 41 kDa [Phytophthora pseudosyringae]